MATPDDEPIWDPKRDPRSTEDLIKTAVEKNASGTDEDDEAYWDEYWDAILILHNRPTREVFEAAQHLCESYNAIEREVGVDVLRELGYPERPFLDESVGILIALLEHEGNVDVLSAIGMALHFLKDRRVILPLITLKNHPDKDVRFGVVYGLLTHDNEAAIDTLIELMSDEDSHVRDWATFGIGTQISTDTEKIRDALVARLNDPHPDIRAEAISGLAARKDPRVIDAIVEALEAGLPNDYAGGQILDAIEEVAYPRLYPHLIKAKENWTNPDWSSRVLDDAIAKCQEKPQD